MTRHTIDRRESRATFVEKGKDRILYRLVNKESRRRCIIFGSYFTVFVVGVILGLIPYILQYINEAQADREVLRLFVEHQEKLYNATGKYPQTMALSSKRKTIVSKKIGKAKKNASIELTCGGELEIMAVKWDNILTSKNTRNLVSGYCKKNMQAVGSTNTCFVDVKKALSITNEYAIDHITIEYICTETI
eukprot:gene13900-15348_t